MVIPGPFEAPTCFWFDVYDGTIFRVDIDTDVLSASDMYQNEQQIMQQDHAEIKSFVTHDVFDIKLLNASMLKSMSCTWVRRWKWKQDPETKVWKRIIKCRLCVRGFLDPQKGKLSKHSSTSTRLSQKLLCSLSCMNYGSPLEVESWDVSVAFLQGFSFAEMDKVCKELNIAPPEFTRDAYITVPENVWYHLRQLKVPGSEHACNKTHVLHLKKGIYGLADAPLLWQLCLRHFLIKTLNGRQSLYDENFFSWIAGGRIVAVMTVHVDDLCIAAESSWLAQRRSLLENRFGQMSRQTLPFQHVGCTYSRLSDRGLSISQKAFAESIQLIVVDKSNDERAVTSAEQTSLRAALGALLYLCLTRIDLLADVVLLQTKICCATVGDLK